MTAEIDKNGDQHYRGAAVLANTKVKQGWIRRLCDTTPGHKCPMKCGMCVGAEEENQVSVGGVVCGDTVELCVCHDVVLVVKCFALF